MKERLYLGEGNEHYVVKADLKKPTVLKKPKSLTQLGVFLNGGVESLRQEQRDIIEQLQDTNVMIPDTRIFAFGNSYIIAQEYIEEDASVSIPEYLRDNAPERLRQQYESNASNFRASEDTVYRIDTTVGRDPRFLLATRLITYEQVTAIKDVLRKVKIRVRGIK